MAIGLCLASSGIGIVSANDDQLVELEQVGAYPMLGLQHLLMPKVQALEHFYRDKPNFRFIGYRCRNQAPEIFAPIQHSNILVAACNTITGHTAAASLAHEFRKPIIHAGVDDGRYSRSGMVFVDIPDTRNHLACMNCLIHPDAKPDSNAGLPMPVIFMIAGFVCHIVIDYLIRGPRDWSKNYYVLDLDEPGVHGHQIGRDSGCSVCGDEKCAPSVAT